VNTTARVASLHYYPVKSARGIELEQVRLTKAGFEDDRRWMIVSHAGRFLTQRELPRLALLRPWLSAQELVLRAPAVPEISVPLTLLQGERRRVSIWNDSCEALDEGDAVAEWLSRFLARECRLVRFDASHRRLSASIWTGADEAENRFSDGFPILAVGTASLSELNARLITPLPLNRFRANLVLEGLEPYDEDRIDTLVTDGVELRVVKPCTRCRITTTNQDTGQLEGEEPLRMLKSYRYDAALRGVCFGQNVILVAGAGRTLARGQLLQVRWKRAAVGDARMP
jgi:hypothetical protein